MCVCTGGRSRKKKLQATYNLTTNNDNNLHFDVHSSSSPPCIEYILMHANMYISTKLIYNLLFHLIISHLIIPFCNVVFNRYDVLQTLMFPINRYLDGT